MPPSPAGTGGRVSRIEQEEPVSVDYAYDGSVADIGKTARFRVIVERARKHLLTGKCTDIPPAGYELAIARTP